MKKPEWILYLFALIAYGLQLAGLSGGATLTVFALVLLGLVYLIFSFALLNGIGLEAILKKASYREVSPGALIGAIIAGFFFVEAIIGILFALEKWLKSGEVFRAGLLGLAFLGAFSFLFFWRWKKDWTFFRNLFLRILILGGIMLLMLYTF